jgi:hypothetical protein
MSEPASGAEPTFPGTDLVETAFAEGLVGGVGAAMTRLQATTGRDAVRVLASTLRPWRWTESRSAMGALRRQGAAALPATPVMAAWVVLSAGAADATAEQHAVHDALLALADLYPRRADARSGAGGSDADRIAQFFAEAVDAHLLALFALPTALWHRGLVAYFRRNPTAPDLLATALESLIVRRDPAPPGYEDWFEYLRAEALSLIGELGPHVELARLERLWHLDEATRTSVGEADVREDGTAEQDRGRTGAPPDVRGDPIEALIVLAGDPEASVRVEALLALARKGAPDARLRDLAIRAARSTDASERRAAARLLASIGDA